MFFDELLTGSYICIPGGIIKSWWPNMDIGHTVALDNAFLVCYTVTTRVPKGVGFRLFCKVESIGIRIVKPGLYIPENLAKPLMLPWLDI